MKRSLFVIHYPMFGGPHNQAMRLDAPLRERGWETVVVLPDEEGNAAERLRTAGVEVIKLRLHRLRAKLNPRFHVNFLLGLVGGVRALRRVIRDREIDLVVVGGLVNPHGAIAARLEGVPVVWQLLDTRAPSPLVRLLMPLVIRLSDSVMSTGMAVARAHPGTEKLGKRLIPYFPPVDTSKFFPDVERKKKARARLGIPDDAEVIGNVSNINPQKGQGLFVEAAASLLGEHPNAIFTIMGATYPQHSAYLDRIKVSAKSLGLKLGENFIIADPGSEVDFYGAALDVFWLTSEPRSEGIPTVVEEALALGLPVVATDVGAVSEAVLEGKNGFVIGSQDADAIANATSALLADPSRLEEMAQNARQSAVDLFAIEKCADIHVHAFETAITHHASHHRKHDDA